MKAATKEISNFHLIDINLKGNSRISLENGTVTFSALKFTSTSYNNDVILIIVLKFFNNKNINRYYKSLLKKFVFKKYIKYKNIKGK